MLALLVVVLFLLLYHTRYDIILSSKTSCAGDRHNMPVTLTFDVLTLKVVSESHVTWATCHVHFHSVEVARSLFARWRECAL